MATEVLPPLPKGATTLPPLPSGALNIDSLDKDTGALKSLRATVSAYKKPEDKLKIIKKYYPDAIPFGSDNYVFKNPKTKRPTLFNPEGLDFGDFAEYGRIGANIFGGIVGFIPGAVAASPTVAGIPVLGAVTSSMGSVAAGEAYDAALRSIFGEGIEDTRTAGEYATDLAIEGTIEAVMPFPVAKGVTIARETANKLVNSPQAKAIVNSAKNLGIDDLPLGVTSGPKVARIENALATTTGGSPVVNAYSKGLKDLEKAVDDITALGSNQTEASAGELIFNAVQNFETKFIETSNGLYKRVGNLIDYRKTFEMPNTSKVLKANEFKFKNKELNSLFGKGAIDNLNQLFKGETPKLNYNDIANLRTEIGRQLKGTFVVGTSPSKGELKLLYKALSDDMFNAAKLNGGDAHKVAQLANNYYQKGSDIIEKELRPLVATGGKNFLAPEKIYQKLNTNIRTKPSETNKTLTNIFNKNLGNEDQLIILGEKQLSDLVKNPKGEFSIGHTLTSLNKLKKGTGHLPVTLTKLGTKIDDVEQVTRGFHEAGKSVNFSNTAFGVAHNNLYAALGLGGVSGVMAGDPTTGLSVAASTYVLPRVISAALENPATRSAVKNWALKSGLPPNEILTVMTSVGIAAPIAQSIIEETYKKPEPLLD